MTAHIVMPARWSEVPDHLVRRCTGCAWAEWRPPAQWQELDRLARQHHEHPGGDEAAGVPA